MNEKKLLFKKLVYIIILFFSNIIYSQVSNYNFSQYAGSYTDLTSVTTPTYIVNTTISTSWDDGVTSSIPIPFAFQMNGTDYTSCSINYNGFITFGNTISNANEYFPISSSTAYSNAISALGMDIWSSFLNPGSSISYATVGSYPNREFVVQWKNVIRKADFGTWDFQIRLKESSNEIKIVYGACSASSNSPVTTQIGVRGNSNSDFTNRRMTSPNSWLNNTSQGSNNSNSVITRNGSVPASGTTFLLAPYCTPNFNNTNKGRLYINKFQFIGVLNNPPANTSTFALGYQDFTGFTPVAQQPQGAAINLVASRGSNNGTNGTWKAWVDWNKDGDFVDPGEEVYNMITFTTPSVTFGFIIPTTALGNYRLRIGTFDKQNNNFTSCSTANGYGEMEDYLFTVVPDCSAKVVSINDVNLYDGQRCGPGSVVISATGNASAFDFKWYDSAYGGTLLGTGNTFLTPSISTTTTYYVTATTAGNTCETPFRYPVEARIDPNPTVAFSTSDPAICGEEKPSLLVNASGDKYQEVYFEKFNSGLGLFTNVRNGSYTNVLADWQTEPSPYLPPKPPYEGLSPALSSGYFGAGYAMINTDINRNSTT